MPMEKHFQELFKKFPQSLQEKFQFHIVWKLLLPRLICACKTSNLYKFTTRLESAKNYATLAKILPELSFYVFDIIDIEEYLSEVNEEQSLRRKQLLEINSISVKINNLIPPNSDYSRLYQVSFAYHTQRIMGWDNTKMIKYLMNTLRELCQNNL